MEKICSKCKKSLLLCEFSLHHPAKKNGKRRPDCKQCVRDRSKVYINRDPAAQSKRMAHVREKAIRQAKELVNNYLETHSCVDCGEHDKIVLDFDHVRGRKICDVSRMVSSGYRLWRITEEIAKCEVRCANCHRKITQQRAGLV